MNWERPHPTLLHISLDNLADTERLGRILSQVLKPGDVVGLIGNLGAGKTQLIRAIAEALDVDPAAISSPTFVLIHEYEGRLPIFHFDAYRLRSVEEFDALGGAEYFDSGGICLIEWADRIPDRLPEEAWLITLKPSGSVGSRLMEIRAPQDRIAELIGALATSSTPGGLTGPLR
jgi:tRNA threonylcarbamoyladenosine biosynthesis protein TsaE